MEKRSVRTILEGLYSYKLLGSSNFIYSILGYAPIERTSIINGFPFPELWIYDCKLYLMPQSDSVNLIWEELLEEETLTNIQYTYLRQNGLLWAKMIGGLAPL
jgi:hypothetical protein